MVWFSHLRKAGGMAYDLTLHMHVCSGQFIHVKLWLFIWLMLQ